VRTLDFSAADPQPRTMRGSFSLASVILTSFCVSQPSHLSLANLHRTAYPSGVGGDDPRAVNPFAMWHDGDLRLPDRATRNRVRSQSAVAALLRRRASPTRPLATSKTVSGPVAGMVTTSIHDALRRVIGVVGPGANPATGNYPASNFIYYGNGRLQTQQQGTSDSAGTTFTALATVGYGYDAGGGARRRPCRARHRRVRPTTVMTPPIARQRRRC